MSVRTPFDAWWRNLNSVERQLGRLEGVDRAVLEPVGAVDDHRIRLQAGQG